MIDPRLASLLGQWHEWRGAYSHERGFARVAYASPADEDDELERLTMNQLEEAIASLPQEQQLALQHVARAQSLGVEVIMNPRLGNTAQREALIAAALAAIQRKLLSAGVL